MHPPSLPILNYRGKTMTPRPLFEFRRSNPPINDLFAGIRIALIWITLYTFLMRPSASIHLGSTWYMDFFDNNILLMQMHPNYSERLPGFFLQSSRPDFVHTILSQAPWPYARWIRISSWLVLLLWFALVTLTWRLTRFKTAAPNENRIGIVDAA